MAARSDPSKGKAPVPGDASKIRVDPSRALKSSAAKPTSASSGDVKKAAVKSKTTTTAAGAKTAKPKGTGTAKGAAQGQKKAASSVDIEKRNRDLQYKAMLHKDMHEKRKAEILESFKKLQVMSLDDLQVEFIVCIRAQHYRDALMYSEIILEKDPGNQLVAQFQPLLANLSVQNNPAVDSEEEGDGEEDEVEGDGDDDDEDDDEDDDSDEDSNSDDPETAWMWSETWRTDPDDEPEEGPSTEGPTAERSEAGPAAGPTAEKTSPS